MRQGQGDFKGSIDDFSKASSIERSHNQIRSIEGWLIDDLALIYKSLGDSQLKLGDYKAANDAYGRAITHIQKFPQSYEGRAKARDGLGDTSGADQDRATADRIRSDPKKVTKDDIYSRMFGGKDK